MEKLFRRLVEKFFNSRYSTYELDANGNETTEPTDFTGGDPQYSGVMASFMTFIKENQKLACQQVDVYRKVLG